MTTATPTTPARQFKLKAEDRPAGSMTQSEAIQHHYDNDTRFFSLWLDPSLTYSSGRWFDPITGADLAADLTAAQDEKLRFHLDAAKVEAGTRLIDIGCGWGATLRGASQDRGAAYALGLTLSNDQLSHIESQGWPNVEARLQDAYTFTTDEPFTAAISIGAFEHFAKPNMTRPEKIEIYARFFETMAAALTTGARFSLQTIVWEDVDFEHSNTSLPETVFPESSIPYIEEVVEASAPTFRLVYLENDPKHYATTLQHWINNIKARQDDIIAEWGEEKYNFFYDYLRYSRLAFTRRKNSLARFVLQKR
ncbi:cyclopropane-fatty-acyl-phospholipid synthase [Acuticoccus sediminis]|uniref:Cyclopropane-fatty-acyl-phospholipid synthase n=1 Tax=Acuticoccus sediminis TaxID=2184697 RepID=A0A8B2NSE3_9HYPH|nr:class I SAM-dependent methyltransferase [Acuticoccus sediminis]RAI03137.1 cyclopropane-fatty-acyl-phospholipid synthase [Acuticoccus sediminis]